MTAVAAKEVTTRQVSAVRFGFYTDEEVQKLSVKRLVQPMLLDSLRNPIPGGLYDPALGPTDRNGRCTTCMLNANDCPGHFGHIVLPVPVFNPLIFGMLYRLLRQQCHYCYHLRIDREEAAVFETKLALLCSGRLTDAMAMQVSRMAPSKELTEFLDEVHKGAYVSATEGMDPGRRTGGKLTSLTLEAIRDTIHDLFAKVPTGKCRNCGSFSPHVKKQGGPMKVFKYWPSAKGILMNAKLGRKIRSVIAMPTEVVGEMETAAAAEIDAEVQRRSKGKGMHKEDKKDVKLRAVKDDVDFDEEEEEEEEGGVIMTYVDGKEEEKGRRMAERERREEMDDDEMEGIIRENEAAREAAMGEDGRGRGDDLPDITPEIKKSMGATYMTSWEIEEMIKRLFQTEWRLLALVLGPGKNMWSGGNDPPAVSRKGRHGLVAPARGPKGIELGSKGGRLVVNFSPEAEKGAKEAYSMFFVRTLPVPPNKFRPPSVMGEQMYEHPQNTSLQRVLTACLDIGNVQEGMATAKQLQNITDPAKIREMELNRLVGAWATLQDAVCCLMDSTMATNAPEGTQGIRQALEKKEGLFRKNMMGKRVNFAARSVISPDPFIGTGEIGIPPYFAMRLCFPERVTPWNVERLRESVMRGPYELNGAVAIEDGRGRVINLKLQDEKKRAGLAKALLSTTEGGDMSRLGLHGSGVGASQLAKGTFVGSNKIVYRHLRDGDLMLTNRQPTLHKPGLMAHRARVLKGEKTIRMHYANCATFNADFDGDEINLHLPQDHFGRAEGYGIVHADHQYIVPTDGKPIRGLIQDHVVAGVLLTKRDTWLTREEYTQLCYLACSAWRSKGAPVEGPDRIELEPPAILKPWHRWSGKQVVSTAVSHYTSGRPPLTFSSGSKVPAEYWGGKASGEAELIFHKGYMVSGCIDKNQFGKFGLVHAVQEMYGGPAAGALLSSFSRLFTAYLQMHGFTCGFDDLLLVNSAEEKRKSILSHAETIALRASAEFVGMPLPEAWAQDPVKHAQDLFKAQAKVNDALSERYRSSRSTGAAHDMKGSGVMHPMSSEVVKACLPGGQVKPFPGNCLSLMTISGAKGGLVNFSQISCLLGQQELEGRRVPRMASGATLPCFAPYDGGARSCGFVGDRFLSGLRPQEYYFHCMAGREGLIDTTVKTSRSGYLQRCLVKNLETLRVHYDYTVRDNADGSIVQFFYGDDGLDVTQVSYMDQLGFLARNAPRFSQALNAPAARTAGQLGGMGALEAEVSAKVSKRAERLSRVAKASLAGDAEALTKAMARLNVEPPLMSTYPPSVLAATSEAFTDKLLTYVATNQDDALRATPAAAKEGKEGKKSKKHLKVKASDAGKVDAEEFINMMCLKYMRALAAPGEAVGVLAAQSVGEPSTQMTLNTFHMAGRGEANVTLGIPRLREILMTAAPRIKTPVMTLPLKAGLVLSDANVLAGRMRRLRLAECLAGVSLQEQPVCRTEAGAAFSRAYMITLKFFSPSLFPPEAGLTFSELVEVFRRDFCPELRIAVNKAVKNKGGKPNSSVVGRVDKSQLRGEEEGEPINEAGPVDEDGDGEVGGSNRGRAKRSRAKEDDAEEGQDQPVDDDDDGDAAERDDDAAEGKMRFRGLNDDTTYDAPDEEDERAAQDAVKEANRRALLQDTDESENEHYDFNDDDNDQGMGTGVQGDGEETAQKPSKAKRKGKGDPAVAGDKAPTSAEKKKHKKSGDKAEASGAELDVGEGDVDYSSHSCRVSVFLPLHAPKLLMLEVVERVAAAVMVRHTTGIDKVYVLPGDRGEGPRVQTDGVSFRGVWDHSDLVDVNGITTNDVAAMLRTYGVEAARATILREVKSVFAAYGIGVDPRHLGLIADFMTHQGGYRACNRMGIESSVSPFLKMSFETAAHFLTDATLRHASDDLLTPSARLCVGRVVELGTGVMSVVHRFDAEEQTAAA